MSILNNIEIPHKTAYELQDKKAAIEAIMNLDAEEVEKIRQLLTASNGADLLNKNWWLISKKLKH